MSQSVGITEFCNERDQITEEKNEKIIIQKINNYYTENYNERSLKAEKK